MKTLLLWSALVAVAWSNCCNIGSDLAHCYDATGDWADLNDVDCDDPIFMLYTNGNQNIGRRIYPDQPAPSEYNGANPTTFLTHGYNGNVNGWVDTLKDAFLNRGTYNVITIDWSAGATKANYLNAVSNTRVAGYHTYWLMHTLDQNEGSAGSRVWCSGHSLGSHVCGLAGMDYGRLGRITGMDPAGPWWNGKNLNTGLDSSDAAFVDNLHTDGGTYGTFDRRGHVDMYPNGGENQPGCGGAGDVAGCSHGKAHEYMINSVNDLHLYPSDGTCNPAPTSCSSNGCNGCPYMGYAGDERGNDGSYHVTI